MGTRSVVGIIQARMGSARLPGKVMMDLEGKTALARVYTRAARAESLDHLLIATTTEAADDPIAAYCDNQSIACFRGHATDVLDRVYKAAKESEAEIIVRLTGDCPLIDPDVIDQSVQAFQLAEPPLDFLTNRLPGHRTYPIGLDTEVCSFDALERAWTEANQPYQREHVMPYLYEDQARFRILCIDAPSDYGHLRWTLDTVEDLAFLREIYRRFEGQDTFSWQEVLAVLEREPELANLNANIPHRTHRDEDTRTKGSNRPGREND